MKVCLISHSDSRGGAHRAAYRLHKGLQQLGAESTMMVAKKLTDDFSVRSPARILDKTWVKIAPTMDNLPKLFYPQRDRTYYSTQWFPDTIVSQVAKIAPDIINLHWINFGFIRLETLAKLQQPIVWTFHDMWPLTGGCHYTQECDRYTQKCGSCPQLHSQQDFDLSRWTWKRKAKAWKNLNLTIVTPSVWLANCVKSSSLFQDYRVEVIANSLDIKAYKPIDKQLAKNLLGLPQDRKIILFGAVRATSEPRKGFHLLQLALQKLAQFQEQNSLELVVFGASPPKDAPDFGFPVTYLGKLNDDISLSLLYSAADVFVCPSLQDNLPNTIMESLACGTPGVAFNIGGMPDLIEHQVNGYLAEPFAVEDFARGIAWILEDTQRYGSLIDRARQKVEQEFTQELQCERYSSLFDDICIDLNFTS